jgi:hypothetical protein
VLAVYPILWSNSSHTVGYTYMHTLEKKDIPLYPHVSHDIPKQKIKTVGFYTDMFLAVQVLFIEYAKNWKISIYLSFYTHCIPSGNHTKHYGKSPCF